VISMVETIEKLYDVRETFDLVLENINDLICIVNQKKNYKIEMINQRVFQETLGYSRNELIGRSFLELIMRGEGINPSSIMENALHDNEKPNEIKIKKNDGNFVWAKIKSKQAKTIDAQERMLIILKDISQFKTKEKDFNDVNTKFELISNYSDDFYAILNNKFEYEYINERVYKESLGFEKDEIVGKTSLNLIYPDDVQKAVMGLREGFDKGENFADIRIRKKNGGYVWIETKGRTFIDKEGNKKAFLVGRDITARKEAEQKLKESEEKFRTITEQSMMGIVILQDGKVKYANEKLASIYGYEDDDIFYNWQPGEFLKAIHPDYRKIVAEQVRRKSSDQEDAMTRYSIKVIKKSGETVWIENFSKPIFFEGRPALLGIQIDITDKVEIAEQLKESEEKYRSLFENSPNAIFLIDTQGIILDCNSTSEQFSEFKKRELIGKSFMNVAGIPEEYLPIVLDNMKLLLKGENVEIQDIQLNTKSRGRKWVSIQGSLIKFGDDNIMQVIIQDVSEKKEAELEIEASRKKLELYINSMTDGFCINDSIGTIVQINKSFVQMFGYEFPEQFIGKKIFDFVLKEEVPGMSKRFLETIKHKELEIRNYEVTCLKKDNSVFTGSFNIRNLWENEKYIGSISNARNITEKKLAEQRLKESEESYRILFNKSPFGIAISNRDNEILLVNNKIEEITGYSKEELNIINLESLYIDAKQHSEILEIAEKYGLVHDYEVKIRHKSGTKKTCLLNVDKHKISGASIFQTTLQDITKSKELDRRYRDIFEKSPTSLWQEDFSEIKTYFDDLKEKGIYDFNAYFEENPDEVKKCAMMVKVIDINKKTLEIYKAQSKKVFFNGLNQVFTEDSFEVFKNEIVTFIGGKTKFESEAINIDFMGELINIYIVCEIVSGHEEDWSEVLISIIDITNLKQIEQNLRISEERLSAFKDAAPMSFVLFDSDLNVVDVNQNALSRFPPNTTKEDVIGKNLRDFAPDVKELERFDKYKEVIKTGLPFYSDDITVHPQYGNISLELRAFKVGEGMGFITIDNTERKLIEQQLKESEEKFRTIAEQSMMGICIVQDNQVKYLNKVFPKIWGYTIEEMINWTIKDIQEAIYPEDREFIIDQLRKKQEGQSDIELNYMYRGMKKSGEIIWIENYSKTIIYQEKPADLVTIIDITERMNMEEQLKESEKTYREREKNLVDIILEMNIDGRINYISHQVSNVLGYKEVELIGTNGFDLAHPDDVQQIQQSTEESYKQNKPIYFEFRAKHKDGYYKPMSARGNIVLVDNIPKIVGTVKDDSEKKEAESKIKESEEKYRNLFDTSPNTIILMDKKGLIIDCNSTTEIMLGYTKEDLIGENYLKLQAFSPTIKPLERIKVMDPKKKIHRQLEIQVKKKDGNTAWITAQTSNIKISDKKLLQVIIKDVTEKRNYEELISELNMNFLTFTADVKNNMHLLLNTCCGLLNGTLALFVNKTMRDEKEQYEVITSDKRMFTYDAGDFEKSIHLSEFFREEHDYSQILQNINDTEYASSDHFIKNHGIKGCYGKLIKLKDDYDGLLCVLFDKNPEISQQDDLVMFLICDAIEIEQRRWEAREQLEAQNEALSEISKLKSDLLSRTSHELKTPLISIKGFTELILTRYGYKLDSDVISLLDEIKDGSKRLERIIHSLLQSSKLEQDKVILNTSQEDLSFLIRFCVKEVESLAALRGQTISVDLNEKIITKFDKERLYDVIINLLSNAIKNTPPEGEITIFTEHKNDSIVVSVKDSGVGITEEEKKKLFKKFGKIERYGQSWDINIEGTGLGLYIAKKIVRLHGGSIWVESEGRNKGSTFSFLIPKV